VNDIRQVEQQLRGDGDVLEQGHTVPPTVRLCRWFHESNSRLN
jgi:hypothetical protein